MRKLMNVFCLIFVFMLCLNGCVVIEDGSIDTSSENNIVETSDTDTQTEPIEERTNIANYNNTLLEITDVVFYSSEDGYDMVKITAIYTNNNSELMYALCSFGVKVIQDDLVLEDCSDINGSEESLTKEIRHGETVEVSYVFKLSSLSDIEVLISSPTAEEEILVNEVYLIEK